jgi:geranylgeranyl diphosphate synthase type I
MSSRSPANEAFSGFLAEVRPEVERRLSACWSDKLRDLAPHGPSVLAMASAARDLTLRGGKRYRAALLATAYVGVAPSAPLEPAFAAGAALELFQSYLLIQDDWMDGDALRRGGPSVHAALAEVLGDQHAGNASAILASDLTWGMALGVLATLDAPPERVLRVLQRFCRVHEDVVVGQELDLLGDTADVEAMHALKTGSYTVRGPLTLGAELAGASLETIAALERYAAPVGVAFQLRDDLLSSAAPASETGKAAGGDLRAGKRTAVLAEATKRADAMQRAAIDRVLGRADASADAVAEAMAALDASGAHDAVAARLDELCRAAAELAESLPVSERARELLVGAALTLRVAR